MKTTTAGFEETMVKGGLDAGSHAAANRVRSNTWSVGCQPMTTTGIEAPKDEGVALTTLHCSSAEADSSGASSLTGSKDPATNFRKNWTRRNAWGNLSYAELITKAIESSAEKRLTLSQIYDWIVHNVDYFANKGDNSSSAGWKNSIRHNLSLHSRFVRLVNDGAGKSSWWSINPDAQPLKPSRRRAATMDSKTLLRKRIGDAGGPNRKLDFAGRSLEEVDSTTSGPGFSSSSSMLSPGTSSQDEVMTMDVGISGSPSRYPKEHGNFPKAGSLSGTVPGDIRMTGETGSGTPPYGVRDASFRMDLFGGKGPNHDPGLCLPSPENLSVHGKGQLNSAEGQRGAHGKQQRRPFVSSAPLNDDRRSMGLGFCAGSGIFYDGGFDPPPHLLPDNGGFYPKRYFDDNVGCYATGLDYGSNCHNNGYYQGDAYAGGFYGNGGCFNNRTFPNGIYAGGSDSVGPMQGTGRGQRAANGGGQVNGQGLRVFPEVRGSDQNGSRSNDGPTGDENRELNAFPVAGYCSPYVDMEGIKGTGGYDAAAVAQGPFLRHDNNDCFRDDGVLRIPSASGFQEEEQKTEESSLTDSSFLRALTTVSGYHTEDFHSNPDALSQTTLPSDLSSHDPYYRSTAGNKYPYPSDQMMAKPFSQLLANRATYPTCRNASTIDGFYIPTTF